MIKIIHEKEWTKELSFEEILKVYDPLITNVASSFAKSYKQELEDMLQSAKMYLWLAFLAYKSETKVGFGYFAKKTITFKFINHFRDNSKSVAHTSLNINISTKEDSNSELIDIISDDKDYFTEIIQKCDLKTAMNGLNSRRKGILVDYFCRNKTQSEIAKQLNMSQVNVSREIRTAIAQLKKYYRAG